MRLREIYMQEAFQTFPEMAKRILHRTHKSSYQPETGMNCFLIFWIVIVFIVIIICIHSIKLIMMNRLSLPILGTLRFPKI